MKNEREKINVSVSHVGLRTAAFILAVVLGIGGISFGVAQIGHRDPGYYEIETIADEDVPLYANGFSLVYYLDGESSEIKQEMNALKDLYSSALLRSYKLVDTETTYDGFVNLASLNESLGREVQVSGELFQILVDAWEKTQEQKGFHLFAGALYEEWDSILTLDDLTDFDPATNPDMASRIQALAEKTAELSHFDLEVVDAAQCTVKISVDPDYLDFLKENEYSESVLSLNRMADAYRLDLVRNALEERGYTNGYLTTDSGLTVSLSGHNGVGAFGVYGYEGSTVSKCASVDIKPNSACSYLRAFPMEEGELMYHVVSDDMGERYYHPSFVTATGSFAQVLSASAAVRYDGDVVRCCYENLVLYNQDSREAVSQAAAGGTVYVCAFRSDLGKTVYSNRASEVNAADGVLVKSF